MNRPNRSFSRSPLFYQGTYRLRPVHIDATMRRIVQGTLDGDETRTPGRQNHMVDP